MYNGRVGRIGIFEQHSHLGNPWTRRTTRLIDGFDTAAKVCLNGKEILNSNNMFLQYMVKLDADNLLLPPGDNVLLITFQSALRVGKAREAQFGKCMSPVGDGERLYMRKAQYYLGRDWGKQSEIV